MVLWEDDMEIGKVPSELLYKIIRDIKSTKTEDVLLGAGLGQDCGILDYGDWACAVSSDPITGSGSRQGYLGVHISCNDIAASGAKPIGVTLTILMPKGSEEADIKIIMDEAKEAAQEISVSIIGGHTEITEAVNRPVISVTAIGKLRKKDVMYPHNIQAGDKLILTKFAGLEGSAILAQDCGDYLIKCLDKETIEKASEMLKNISVCKEAKIAMEHQSIYMHDVTEGGLLGAVWEVAEAANKGVVIDGDKVLIKKETKEICKALDLNPLKLISSGSMLVVVKPEQAETLVYALQKEGVSASVIGEVSEELNKYCILHGNKRRIEAPEADHLFKGLEKAKLL